MSKGSIDHAGLAIGYVKRFTKVPFGELIEELPEIHFDAILQIKPPRMGEINFAKVRAIIYRLTEMGMNIKWVSLDSWQSTDTIQIMKSHGYKAGLRSVDKTMLPYDLTKAAFYDGRIVAPYHAVAKKELTSLEVIAKKGKIDHPPKGSKDVSDAIAGVVYGLTMRREIWLMHGANTSQRLRTMIETSKKIARDVKQQREEIADGHLEKE